MHGKSTFLGRKRGFLWKSRFLVEMRFLGENAISYRKWAQKPLINHREYWCFCTWARKVRKLQKSWKDPRKTVISWKTWIYAEIKEFQNIHTFRNHLSKTLIILVNFNHFWGSKMQESQKSRNSHFFMKILEFHQNPAFFKKKLISELKSHFPPEMDGKYLWNTIAIAVLFAKGRKREQKVRNSGEIQLFSRKLPKIHKMSDFPQKMLFLVTFPALGAQVVKRTVITVHFGGSWAPIPVKSVILAKFQ